VTCVWFLKSKEQGVFMDHRTVIFVVSSLVLSGCATQTTSQGSAVELSTEKPQGCRYIGEAVGSQGNSLTGDFTKDSNLIQGARNDIRNNAGAMGGNYVHVQAANNSSAFGSLGTTNSTVIGNVYFCTR
jgi:hypothetical protein